MKRINLFKQHLDLDETVFSYTNWKYIMGQIGSDADGQLVQQIFSLSEYNSGVHQVITKKRYLESFDRFMETFDKAMAVIAT